jgi:hypothetical protein
MRHAAWILLGAWAASALAGPPRRYDPAFDAHRQITDQALLEALNRRRQELGPPRAGELRRRSRPRAGGALIESLDRRPVYVGAVRVVGGGRWVFRRANPRRGDRPPEGWYALGDVLEGPRHNVRGVPLVRDGDDPDALAEPTGWRRLGRFGDGEGAVHIWEPVAPQGYRSLGVVALAGDQTPESASLPPIACVRREHTWPRVRFRYRLLRSPSDPGFWLRRVGHLARAGQGRHDGVWWWKGPEPRR